MGNLLDLVRDLSHGLRPPADADLRSFEQTLADLIVSADGLSDGDVKRLLQDVGLGLEGKLRALTEGSGGTEGVRRLAQADLKAALLRLAAALNDPGRIGEVGDADLLETLRGRVGEALRHLEHLQLLNLPARDDPNAHLFLQLPLLFGQERTTADLRAFYAERDGRRQIDPENVRVVLRLDLTHLGRVGVDLRVANRIVDCRIDVDGEAQRALFSEAGEDLKAGLERCGYAVRKVACEVRPPAPEEGAPEERRSKIGLDVRA
jgi:hypothetical protein